MSILSDGRERAIECDQCPETTQPMDRDDFETLISTAKNDGWLIRLENGEYVHTCSGCRAGSRLAAAQAKFK
jgi:hypothetical protein